MLLLSILFFSWTTSYSSFSSETEVKQELNEFSQGIDPTLTIMGKSTADSEMTLLEVQQMDFIKMEEAFKTKGYQVASFKLVYIYTKEI